MVGMEVSSTNMGVAGIVMCEVSHTRMRGCIKVDNDNAGVNVGMCESHGAGDRCGRRVVGTRDRGEMGKSRCV